MEILGKEFTPHFRGADGECRDNSAIIPINRSEEGRFAVFTPGKWRVTCPACGRAVYVTAEQSSGGHIVRVKARTALDREVFVAGLYRGIDFRGDWRLRPDRRWAAAVRDVLGDIPALPWESALVRLPLRVVGESGKTAFVVHALPPMRQGDVVKPGEPGFTADGHAVRFEENDRHVGEPVVKAYHPAAGVVVAVRERDRTVTGPLDVERAMKVAEELKIRHRVQYPSDRGGPVQRIRCWDEEAARLLEERVGGKI